MMRQSAWQQRTDYIISVKLDDERNTLSASEKIIYTNNSPNQLKEIYFHLWPNAYKNNETQFAIQKLENGSNDFYFSSEEDKGWIDSLSFKVNGVNVKWYLLDTIDICKIELNQPLETGQKIEITTPFKVKIPKVFSRMGQDGKTYCISQWYPKPAVYDINGWNYFPYLDQGEFYSEFGNFDVSISVPKNYIVAATGDLQNEDEKNRLYQVSSSKFKKGNKESKPENPPSSKEYKTLRFVQNNVHDFAWFCDKRFKIERSEVILKSGKKITTWLYEINPDHSAVHWVDTAILFYSKMLGEYPYNNATAVVTPLEAGGGMEYPTITNVQSSDRGTIVHEVGHNWFYGILANNEREYPWMDESFNTYYEARSEYIRSPAFHNGFNLKFNNSNGNKSVSTGLGESPFGLTMFEYLMSARQNSDQPVNLPSYEFTDKNYGSIIYAKMPLLFHHLQEYLGDSLFDVMMQSYYEKWKFKHPLPDDFFDIARKYANDSLDWFIKEQMNTTQKTDFKIVSIHKDSIRIKNKTGSLVPFSISQLKNDSVLNTRWFKGFEGTKNFYIDSIKGKIIRIDAFETTLDLFRDNNTIYTSGLFKKAKPLKIILFGNFENPYRTQIFFAPIAGANLYNKTMLGLAFYNNIIPHKKFEYVIAPMYSFGTNDIAGYANFERHFSTSGMFKQIHLGVDAARFAYEYYTNSSTYNKISSFLSFDLKKRNMRSSVNQNISLRSVFLFFNKNINTDATYSIAKSARIDELTYNFQNNSAINKNSVNVVLQNITDNGNEIKLFAVFKQTINYDKPKKKLDIRLFGGTFILKDDNVSGDYQYRTTGNMGWNDYTFDHALFGRSENELFSTGLFTHQLIEKDANMHMPISITSTNSWLFSANFVSTIPGPVPLRIFADVAYVNSTAYFPQTSQTAYTPTFQYVAGIKLVVVEDIFEINFPLFNSTDFETAYLNNSNIDYKNESNFQHLARKITFTLNLNKLNPLKAAREISLF